MYVNILIGCLINDVFQGPSHITHSIEEHKVMFVPRVHTQNGIKVATKSNIRAPNVKMLENFCPARNLVATCIELLNSHNYESWH